ncbi:ArpU family phage packaging/lysis transcriptional regulator [Vagococcus fluvialis]|uniref:ArpU family phage packaging/lysis transcriptional regulator n=1 Tax=Vagococcus fluvialis TaxID=2738 RepID=UPI003B21C75F
MYKEEAIIRRRARTVLKTFPKLRRIANADLTSIRSYVFSDTKVTSSKKNNADEKITRKIDADNRIDDIAQALNQLTEMSKTMLFKSYCEMHKSSNVALGNEFGYSDKGIERLKRIALIEFAEAYKCGLLLDSDEEEI